MNLADMVDEKGELSFGKLKTKDDLTAAVRTLFAIVEKVFAGDHEVLNSVLSGMEQPPVEAAPGAHPIFGAAASGNPNLKGKRNAS